MAAAGMALNDSKPRRSAGSPEFEIWRPRVWR